MKDKRIDGYELKKYSKLLKTQKVITMTTLNWCTGQVIMSILTLLDLDHYLVFFKKVDKWIYWH